MTTIIGKKVEMTQIFKENGTVVPVTLIDLESDESNKLEIGAKVVVSSVSKGKGFQGVVKRHNFSGAPASHGHRHDLRAPGSIGSRFPQHTRKGIRMAGRMGQDRITYKGEIVEINGKSIAFKGGVPGARGSEVEIRLNNE